MRPPRPLNPDPFVAFYTPTFRRPNALARNQESVGRQTAADQVFQIVLPDHVGHGVADGLYGRLPWIADALAIGQYINFLCDDDVLAADDVVAKVQAFAETHEYPAVIVTRVIKGGLTLPACDPEAEPVCGSVDLTSYLVRRDVWKTHVRDYGLRYEGDYDHALALHKAGHRFTFCPVLWAIGGALNGRPEIDY